MTTKCKKSPPVSASPTSGYGAGYSGVTAMAVEAPPLPPVVNIIPYAHINNKMLFLFQKKEGLEKTILAEVFREEYKEAFDGQHLTVYAKELNKEKHEMYFGCKSPFAMGSAERCPIGKFIIYRTSGEKPSSFFDFGDPHATVDADVAAFIDELEPNKKYFYTFRAGASLQGYKSYPNLFFSVELVDEAGTILPAIEVITLQKEKKHKKSLVFNKRLKIKPSFLQAAPNPQKTVQKYAGGKAVTSYPGDLGYEDKSMFINKNDLKSERYPKFKFRVISNSTQRKIDINVFLRKFVEFKSVSEGTLVALKDKDGNYIKDKAGKTKYKTTLPSEKLKAQRQKKLQTQLQSGMWEKLLSWDDV